MSVRRDHGSRIPYSYRKDTLKWLAALAVLRQFAGSDATSCSYLSPFLSNRNVGEAPIPGSGRELVVGALDIKGDSELLFSRWNATFA
eukprot:scaffold555655_cov38-Prasinocladus_malaysianus.AAC.1